MRKSSASGRGFCDRSKSAGTNRSHDVAAIIQHAMNRLASCKLAATISRGENDYNDGFTHNRCDNCYSGKLQTCRHDLTTHACSRHVGSRLDARLSRFTRAADTSGSRLDARLSRSTTHASRFTRAADTSGSRLDARLSRSTLHASRLRRYQSFHRAGGLGVEFLGNAAGLGGQAAGGAGVAHGPGHAERVAGAGDGGVEQHAVAA